VDAGPLRLRALLAFAVVAVLSGCGGGPGDSGREAASQPATSVTSAGPPPEEVTLAQLDASKIAVRGAPDWMADDGTNLFVKTDSGSVAVIDPNKSTEARRLSLGAGGPCQGIGADGGIVWSCDPNSSGTTDDVLRVNLKSGKAERFEVGKRPDQGNLAVAAGRVWVITDAGLVGLNVATGQPDPPVDLGVPGTDLAATDELAYVLSRGAGAVVSVDLVGQRVLTQSNVADARALAVADEVWVVTGSELVALEKEGLKETARIPIEGEPCSVAVDEDRAFVVGTEPLLTEVDATTHQVSRVVTDANSECGDIHAAFGSIWLSDNVGDVVYRVPLQMK
jgi:hypothetical protein